MPMPTGDVQLRKPSFSRCKQLPFRLEKAEPGKTEKGRDALDIVGFGSTEAEDRDGEFIHVGFFDKSLEQFMGNPVMPWNHGYGDTQGRWLSVEPVEGKGYWFTGQVKHYGTDLDERRFAQVEEGDVSHLSVGFNGDYHEKYGDRDEAEKWHWRTEGELIECSLCSIPSNRESGFEVAKSMGLLIEPPPSGPAKADERVLEDLKRICGSAEAVRNYGRHVASGGGTLSARVLDAIGNPILMMAELLKAGEVLSAANLADVSAAQDALASVTGRHQAARDRRAPSEEAETEDPDDKSADLFDQALAAGPGLELPEPVDLFAEGAAAILGGN